MLTLEVETAFSRACGTRQRARDMAIRLRLQTAWIQRSVFERFSAGVTDRSELGSNARATVSIRRTQRTHARP